MRNKDKRERVYDDRVVNGCYSLEGKFNLASDTDIKRLILDFEQKGCCKASVPK